MAAVLGIDGDRIQEICGSVQSGYVAPVNYNCPGQIVIAGEKTAVEEAIKLADEAGARRAVALAVSDPYSAAPDKQKFHRGRPSCTAKLKDPGTHFTPETFGAVLRSISNLYIERIVTNSSISSA